MTRNPKVRTRSLRLIPDIPWEPTNDSTGGSELDFGTYAEILANAARDTEGPFAIGVFGKWGTGKSSLMKLIEGELRQPQNRLDTKVIPVWFNAWQYEKDVNPIVPLVGTIIKGIEASGGAANRGLANLAKALRAIAYGFQVKVGFGIGANKGEAGFNAKDIIDRYGELTDPLLDRSLFYDAFELLKKATEDPECPKIVVFLDDLDRCLLDKSLFMLEYIKLVLAQRGFIFFLGLDDRVIVAYLNKRFRDEFKVETFSGTEYLEKIVQLSFRIPSHRDRILTYVQHLIANHVPAELRERFDSVSEVLAIASQDNPRAVIRMLNNTIVDHAIDQKDQTIKFDLPMLVVSRILQEREDWRPMFEVLQRPDFNGGRFLDILAQLSRTGSQKPDVKIEDVPEPYKSAIQIHSQSEPLRRILDSKSGSAYLRNDKKRLECATFLKRVRQIDSDFERRRIRSEERLVSGYSVGPGAMLAGADLTGAELSGVDLSGAILRGANLSRANVRNAKLSNADLTSANLYLADLSDARMIGAIVENGQLEGATLVRALLAGSDFRNATLAGARLRHANLQDCDLTGAILLEADLEGANFENASLRGAKTTLSDEELRSMTVWNHRTVWPSGMTE
jgi:uncharacterized protein YjbI with pentapeptide repeats